jgi:site-specific recombinase XerD
LEVARGRSQKTIRNYDFYLRRFSGWLNENGLVDVEDVTQDVVHKYRLWLNRFKDPIRKVNLKKNTQFQLINIDLLKQFFENEIFVSIINEIFTLKNKIFQDLIQKFKNDDKIKYIQAYDFFDFLAALFLMDTTNKRNGLYIVY